MIDVQNLGKCYQIYNSPRDRFKQFIMPRVQRLYRKTQKQYFREFWALRGVSFQVRRGETMGVIGRNGSGKSTLLQILAGTSTQTEGEMTIRGRIAALLELGSGFNPEYTGRENVYINGTVLGLKKEDIDERFDDIAAFADIGEFIEQPVKTYSSGMFLRLAFAVQAHIDASIVIIDEAMAVGDIFFRYKCYTRLEKLKNSGAVILLVSHSMPDIEQYCERAILLDHGLPQFIGPSCEASKHYYLLNQAEKRVVKKPETVPKIPQYSTRYNTTINRPLPEAFIELTNKSQISNGQALLVGVALCNEAGQPCNSFHQGDLAVFYYEFELAADIGTPICGVLIRNDRGIIVHGKNSWQYENYENNIAASCGEGSKILCRHEIKLDVGVGEYLFEVGLVSIPRTVWARRASISHEEMDMRCVRICHVADVGSFSVSLAVKNNIPVLTHHGIADLPGKLTVVIEEVSGLETKTARNSI